MFRVRQRTTAQPVVAPPDRPTWHGTLTARPERAPQRGSQAASIDAASDRLRVAPWESIPAPWGEPDIRVPYVVITTQPWPEEWWRPNARRVRRDAGLARRSGRVTAEAAIEPVVADGLNGSGPDGARFSGSAPGPITAHQSPSRIGVIPVVRGGAVPKSTDITSKASTRLQDERSQRREARLLSVADAREQRKLEHERLADARAHRKGSLTRLAIFAVGLVISLIAVEAASRRRS